MKKGVLLVITVLLLSISSVAQKQFSNLDLVSKAVANRIHKVMQEWECHDIEPMAYDDKTPTDDVKIQHWVSGERDVRVNMLKYPSVEEATSNLRQFVAYREVTRIKDLGDEAYLHGMESAIAFRKGNLLVFISAIVDVENNITVDLGNATARAKAEHAAEAVVTRAFAQHLAAVLQTL